ncbi:MAG: hypothetical protein V5B40_04705 [Candidatus Accumulibacter meliphilus]|uniref:hypothetical protein n=1 Tax=Candidatus Accumulibacter meliphilus TaxID=2211374 RepID=UPI002FC2FDFF
MAQLLLPIFPDAVTPVKELLSVGKQNRPAVYFDGVLPVSLLTTQRRVQQV